MTAVSRRVVITGIVAIACVAASPSTKVLRRTLTAAGARTVDIWIWPARGRRLGRIHFSHGNFSSPIKYQRLCESWARSGWEVLAPLHVDSTDHPEKALYSPLQSWAMRMEDMALLSREAGAGAYVAAGHSYGALIALVLGGAKPLIPAPDVSGFGDRRVGSVLALSPPGALPGLIDNAGFSGLGVPALIVTGDKDIFPGQPAEAWRLHLTAFEVARPDGDRFALILEGVDHYFGGIFGRPELPGPKHEDAYAVLQTITKQFLGTFGRTRPSKTPRPIRWATLPAPHRIERR